MGYHFSSRLTATLDLCLIYFKTTLTLAILLEHMHKKFEINQTKIRGGCQSVRKVVTHNSKSDLPLQPGWRLLRLDANELHHATRGAWTEYVSVNGHRKSQCHVIRWRWYNFLKYSQGDGNQTILHIYLHPGDRSYVFWSSMYYIHTDRQFMYLCTYHTPRWVSLLHISYFISRQCGVDPCFITT